jgi:hypothetical protein
MTTGTETAPKPTLPQIMPAGGQVVAVVPQTVEEIFRLGKGIVQSGLAPYALTGKTDTEEGFSKAVSAVAIVIMAGAELGLPPMVSLRSFTAINGRPALYGDGLINVVRRSGRASMLKVGYTRGDDWRLFVRAGILPTPEGDTPEELAEDKARIRALFEAMPIDERTGGFCEAKRNDSGEEKSTVFTVAQAKKAGLWQTEALIDKEVWSGPKGNRTSKKEKAPNDSPWFRYPERMCGWRAAGFNLRELFGDVLGGITDDWEAREIAGMIDVTPQTPTEPRTPPTPPAPPPEEPEDTTIISGTSNEVENLNTPADQAGDFNGDESNVTYVPDGEITPELKTSLWGLKQSLEAKTSEADIEEAFDQFDPQNTFAANDAAIGEAFGIKKAAITALAHKQRDDLEKAGQGGFEFPGDAPMPKGK